MYLDQTTKSAQIVLGEAEVTTKLDVAVSYLTGTTNTADFNETDASTNGTTAVTLVTGAAGTSAVAVRSIQVFNKDTVAHAVIIMLNNNGTQRTLGHATVLPNATYVYRG